MAENIFDTLQEIQTTKQKIKEILNRNGGLLVNETIDMYPNEIKRMFGIVPPTHTVEFYDYDGTLLKTEQVLDGQAATAPLDLPDHSDIELQFVEWNCTFDNVSMDMMIGACYQTIDEKTHIHITIPTDGETLEFNFYYITGVIMDYGDGSPLETLSTTKVFHTYALAGNYVIKLTKTSSYHIGYFSTDASLRKPFINKPEYVTAIMLDRYAEANYNDSTASYTLPFGTSLTLNHVMLDYRRISLTCVLNDVSIGFIVFPSTMSGLSRYSFKKVTAFSISNKRGSFYLRSTKGDKTFDDVVKVLSNGIDLSIAGEPNNNFNAYFRNLETIQAKRLSIGMGVYNTSAKMLHVVATSISITSYPSYASDIFKLSDIQVMPKIQNYNNYMDRLDVKYTHDWPTSPMALQYQYLPALEEFTFPPNVTSIGYNVLQNNILVPTLKIPKTVMTIQTYGLYASAMCNLTVLFEEHTSIPVLQSKSAINMYVVRIYVPDNLLDAWKAATNWSSYASIIFPISDYYEE